MQQRGAGEVSVLWIEIGPRPYEVGICGDETRQSRRVAGDERRQGVLELWMRLELRDAIGRLEGVLERGPALEAVLARDHQLCVGHLERRSEDGGRFVVGES